MLARHYAEPRGGVFPLLCYFFYPSLFTLMLYSTFTLYQFNTHHYIITIPSTSIQHHVMQHATHHTAHHARITHRAARHHATARITHHVARASPMRNRTTQLRTRSALPTTPSSLIPCFHRINGKHTKVPRSPNSHSYCSLSFACGKLQCNCPLGI